MQICECSDVIWLESQRFSVAARGLREFPVQMQHGTEVEMTPRFLKVGPVTGMLRYGTARQAVHHVLRPNLLS
jgi:hypothetical protein